MRLLTKSSSIFLLSICCLFVNDWKLVKSTDTIKVYTKRSDSSSFDQVKVKASVEATLSQVVALLEDLEAQKDWVYATKEVKMIEEKSPGQFQYHYYMKMPFPVKDRDVIIDFSRHQDSQTKVVKVLSQSVRQNDLLTDDYTRINSFESSYILTPMPNGMIDIVYTLNADPGSKLPAWIINMFTTSGPFKSMSSLLELINKGKYAGAEIEGVTN